MLRRETSRRSLAAVTFAAAACACVCAQSAPTPTPTPTPAAGDQLAIAEGARRPAAGKTAPGESVPIPIAFRSPFSLNDCLRLLDIANEALPQGPDALQQIDRDSYLRLLEAVSNYLKERDDLHASLVGYKWETLERVRVRTGLIDSLNFPFTGPEAPPGAEVPLGVTALTFQVELGDILLHDMKVYDPTGNLVAEFRQNPAIVLRHSLPKREFFFLYQPTDIGRVTVAASKATPAENVNPRLHLLVGRANRPEYGKSAIWLIDGARADIRAGVAPDATPDDRTRTVASIRAKIQRAQRDLRLFRDGLREK